MAYRASACGVETSKLLLFHGRERDAPDIRGQLAAL
jgi:hypothetical protein